MTDPVISEQYVQVTIAEPDITDIQIIEQPNLVTVDDENPNLVFVSLVGTQGVRGPGVITGSGEPNSSDGANGDVYIDTDTNSFYGPKASGSWPAEPFYIPGATTRYVHTQSSAADEWIINHPLGGRPSVTVVDSAATMVIGEVSYLSNTQVRLNFSAPFSGYAYLT